MIPKSLKIAGQTIKVIFKKDLKLSGESVFGVWDYNKNKIYLQASTRKEPITQEQIESTYIHELVHACLEILGEEALSKKETFVTGFANLLHQALKSE